ncbi:MAG: tetratricopeptide repeat protein [Planctomycetaceae bacterium]|nr:tetratricopeptide repeat protein [Planctomycetaceae bacterium]
MVEQSPTNTDRGVSSRRRRVTLGRICAVAILIVGGVLGATWWSERPLREAETLLQQGAISKAFDRVSSFLDDHPKHGAAMSLRARILVALGQPGAAIEIFERFGASKPKDLHAWAQAYLKLEQWSKALPILEFVAKSRTDHADVQHELAACRAKLGDFDGALLAANEFASTPGNQARGELLIGTLHQQRGNMRLAASAWNTVLNLSPNAEDLQIPAEEFFLEYGRVLLSLGETSLAADLIQRSLDLRPDDSAYVSLGDALLQSGKSKQAKAAFESALEVNPNSVDARKGLASIALGEQEPNRTIELLVPLDYASLLTSKTAFLLQRAHVLLGDDAEAERWRQRADQLRKIENAQATADHVLRNNPESTWADVLRAYRFALSGNWEQAEILVNRLGPNAEEEPFVAALAKSVRERSSLPPLEDLPIQEK